MKKNYILSLTILFFGSVGYLFYPLTSDRYKIAFDQEKVDYKNAYLSKKVDSVPDSRPNIIIILADDLGYYDISHHGNTYNPTPHIDDIATSGVNFSNAFVTSPICAPSRAGLLTGRYQQRYGFHGQLHKRYLRNRLEYFGYKMFIRSNPWLVNKPEEVPTAEDMALMGIPATELSLAEVLKRQGYQTAAIGKWHVGSADHNVPHNMGFDYHYGFYASHSLFAYEDNQNVIHQHVKEDWSDSYIWGGQRDGEHAIVVNGEEVIEKEYLTKRLKEEAIQFIDQNKDQPFFLYLPFNAPHTPYQASREYYERFKHIEDPYKRVYAAMISEMDDAIGEVNQKIDELGLSENTLIFFLSDNGVAEYAMASDNRPLKGGKITNFQGGLKVPFMMKWKGVIPDSTEYNEMVSSLDIFATSCAVAGVELPTDRVYDGVNLLPFVTSDSKSVPHDRLFWEYGQDGTVLTKEWKLLFRDSTDDQTLLYRISDDPYEKKNLGDQYSDVVQSLIREQYEWQKDFVPPLWPVAVTFEYIDEDGTYYFDD